MNRGLRILIIILLIFICIVIVGLCILSIKFHLEKSKVNEEWGKTSYEKLENVGTVKNLSILPLIEYNTVSDDLIGEQGVSFLITVDDTKILFDFGRNEGDKEPSNLIKNMEALNVKFSDIDYMYLSHAHVDHVGGNKGVEKKSFTTGGKDHLLEGKKIYVPENMKHDYADVEVVSGPKVLSPGVVSIGGIKEAYWISGTVNEQSLAINVEGKGIVLIVACGHNTIEKILTRTKEIFDEPIYAIIAGLHYAVTDFRTGSPLERYLARVSASGLQPWHGPLKKEVVEDKIELIKKENLSLISISPHDSCDWTINKFKDEMSNKFVELAVGKEIKISANE